eukprot:13174848-Alexandrium_andersonii.AAC.1
MLFSMLVGLYYNGKLSAANLCILSFWAERAGARGPVSTVALRPGLQSGSYQRKLDSVLNFADTKDGLYDLS